MDKKAIIPRKFCKSCCPPTACACITESALRNHKALNHACANKWLKTKPTIS